MNMFRLLTADEIECRISRQTEKGLALLLYKTARTDANLLDETVGVDNWKNDFKVVDGVLYGGVGIWSDKHGEWVWKWDAGTESNTEAEKGRASDAFKRAGFKWGIGRELYTAPFIWIEPDKFEVNNNGKCKNTFSVTEIGYNDKGEIAKLLISNDKRHSCVFSFVDGKNTTPKSKAHKTTLETPETQNAEQIQHDKLTDTDFVRCADCGGIIKDCKDRDGNPLDLKTYVAMCMKFYERPLCGNCRGKMKHGKTA